MIGRCLILTRLGGRDKLQDIPTTKVVGNAKNNQILSRPSRYVSRSAAAHPSPRRTGKGQICLQFFLAFSFSFFSVGNFVERDPWLGVHGPRVQRGERRKCGASCFRAYWLTLVRHCASSPMTPARHSQTSCSVTTSHSMPEARSTLSFGPEPRNHRPSIGPSASRLLEQFQLRCFH